MTDKLQSIRDRWAADDADFETWAAESPDPRDRDVAYLLRLAEAGDVLAESVERHGEWPSMAPHAALAAWRQAREG